jgi:hypothetical protein
MQQLWPLLWQLVENSKTSRFFRVQMIGNPLNPLLHTLCQGHQFAPTINSISSRKHEPEQARNKAGCPVRPVALLPVCHRFVPVC